MMNRQIYKITRIPIRNVAFKFKDRLLGNSIAADGLTRSEATGMNFYNYLTQNEAHILELSSRLSPS